VIAVTASSIWGPGMDRTSADSFRVVGRGMSPKVATSVVTEAGSSAGTSRISRLG
jgi:hypothetical protein